MSTASSDSSSDSFDLDRDEVEEIPKSFQDRIITFADGARWKIATPLSHLKAKPDRTPPCEAVQVF
jgi:hypothetical protein